MTQRRHPSRPAPVKEGLGRHRPTRHRATLLRRRNNGQFTTHEQYTSAQAHVRAAVVVLDWLATQHLTLASCRQADLERWLSSGEVSY